MEEQQKWCIYKHTNKINGKTYIGQAKGRPELRWGRKGSNYKSSVLFYRAIQKYGWDNFCHEILFNDLTEDEANLLEIKLINEYNACDPKYGYNIREGGKNGSLSESTKEKLRIANTGKHLTDKTKHKISESMMGELNHFYGKHHDEAAIQKMREAKSNMSGKNNPMYGKHHSEETKEKIRQKRLGSHISLEHKLKVSNPVKCLETGNIYISAKEAARELNIDDGCIGRCCRGKLKTYKGLHWAYPTEEELNEFLTQRGYEPNED